MSPKDKPTKVFKMEITVPLYTTSEEIPDRDALARHAANSIIKGNYECSRCTNLKYIGDVGWVEDDWVEG
jgi:hypothetical protein